MKKILIVNNNLDIGGIQKSLINLLQDIHDEYEVTLLLFSRSGGFLKDVPENVKIITPQSQYRMMGLTKDELKRSPHLFILKAFLMKFAQIFSRRSAMKILGVFQKKISGYDAIISYTHLPSHKFFLNGCGDFVLDKTVCSNKICIIHCDYLNSGYMTKQNNAEYAEFNRIACCSDSVKDRFIQGSGINPDKVYTLRNFFDLNINRLAFDSPYLYDDNYINLISVSRLSREKGIDRAIDALFNSKRTDIRYYIVGDGPQKRFLMDKIKKYNMEEQIFLLGEDKNPYKYMLNADYLLVPSLHEAAPMVFDEAKIIGLRVISTNTTSAEEMIGDSNGIVCENSLDGIEETLSNLGKEQNSIKKIYDNTYQKNQLSAVLD